MKKSKLLSLTLVGVIGLSTVSLAKEVVVPKENPSKIAREEGVEIVSLYSGEEISKMLEKEIISILDGKRFNEESYNRLNEFEKIRFIRKNILASEEILVFDETGVKGKEQSKDIGQEKLEKEELVEEALDTTSEDTNKSIKE